jgi:CheY-like chemotaxis protein
LLAVSDTGVGMDADTLSHMFEPFFTTKEKGKGTGLGLATVYGIVKQSGGYVWVYSEPGHGTTCKIYLPRVEERQEAPRRAAPAVAEDVSGSETILLVEDEEAVRRLVRKVLEGKGYTVLEASGWQEALEITGRHQERIHLLVTDVVMPGVGGPELASRLEAARPGFRVLYMSGYTDGAVVNHGLLSSATAFLQKPFTPDTLLRKVREVLSS